jgi:hypothetical protein
MAAKEERDGRRPGAETRCPLAGLALESVI